MALSMVSVVPSLVTTPPISTPGGSAFAATLPGAGPFGFFDPLDLMADKSSMEIMLYREAEIAHGRVAMMAAVGYLVQEAFHPIFPVSAGVDGPVIRQLDQVLSTGAGQSAGFVLLLAVFFSEIYRAREGWMEPEDAYYTLREGYLPGNLGFDPLGLKPESEADFANMQSKELNNGRLAMMAVAGMTAQELVTGTTLF